MPRRYITQYWTYVATFLVTFVIASVLLREYRSAPNTDESHIRVREEEVFHDKIFEAHTDKQDGYAKKRTKKPLAEESGVEQEDSEGEEEEEEMVSLEQCKPEDPRQIILLTYGRSGSSLTSDIISMDPSVFTYFEPLHNFAKSFTKQQEDYYKKNSKYLHLTDIPEYNNGAIKMVEKMMTCNYFRLNRYASLNLHAPRMNSTKDLFYCIKNALTSRAEEECLFEAQEKCAAKPIKFLKIIRMAVKSLIDLMAAYPCMKIVYLVRDPRGSYYSKQKMFASHGSDIAFDAERFCSRFNKDVDDILALRKKYPDRVMMTRYESIAMHPIVSSKRLFEFVGMEFTKKDALTVYNKTHSKSMSGGFGTDRTNSTAASYKWRESIPYEYVEAFDKYCSEPNYKMGYLPANSVGEIRNLNKPMLFTKDYLS